MYNKNKLCSIIASPKKMTIGHKLRHELIKYLDSKTIDIYTTGYLSLPTPELTNLAHHSKLNRKQKIYGCEAYMFQIVIENSKTDYYYTEKILDCFLTGTIPIYWGCPSIGKFFNINGILEFDNIDDALNIINKLSEDLYTEKLIYVKENYDKAIYL